MVGAGLCLSLCPSLCLTTIQPPRAHTHTQGPSSAMIKSGATSTWSQALPPQYSLLLGNLLVLANFITALLVPWVEAQYKLFDAWFPVYVPVKIGLLKCFSDVCSAMTGGNHDAHSNGHGKSKGGGNNSPPPIPGWGPIGGGGAGGGAPDVGGGGGGAKALFEVAAIFAVILLSISVLLALGGALVEAARIQGRQDISGLFPLQLSVASAVVCLVALLQYLFITLAGLHGGHYVVGFWLTLATAVTTGVLSLGQYLVNKRFFDEEYGDGSGGLFLPSQFKGGQAPAGQVQQQGGSREGGSACAKGCCGGGGGGESSSGPTLVQPRPSYGAV